MPTPIKVLVVDDEALARRGIKRLLATHTDFLVQGEARNGADALSLIDIQKPDVIFLDIQMPLIDGLSLVEKITDRVSEIVFVTAYDEHAIAAFEAGAIDYILKPINPHRFALTLDRIRQRRDRGEHSNLDRFRHLLKEFNAEPKRYLKRITVRQNDRIRFLEAEQIAWMRSQGNYVEVHAAQKKFLVRETMSGMERKLDPEEFVRIRRAILVRIDRIKELQTLFGGEYLIILRDGMQLRSSRRYRQNLERLLKP